MGPEVTETEQQGAGMTRHRAPEVAHTLAAEVRGPAVTVLCAARWLGLPEDRWFPFRLH